MSQRGSFCTEYVYCAKCFEVLGRHLYGKSSSLCSQPIRSWEGGHLPIIAGKISETYNMGELFVMSHELAPKIAKEICHPVRICVLAEGGHSALFRIMPKPEIDVEKEWVDPISTLRKDFIDPSKDIDWLVDRAKELGWVLRPMSQDSKKI